MINFKTYWIDEKGNSRELTIQAECIRDAYKITVDAVLRLGKANHLWVFDNQKNKNNWMNNYEVEDAKDDT